jgi:hypothetical protein
MRALVKRRYLMGMATMKAKVLNEVVFTQQPIWNFFGNRLVEAYVRGNRY